DRPAFSMRNVAIAASIILIATPEAVMHVGFQMSFAAVVALIAFYEWSRARASAGGGGLGDASQAMRTALKARRYLMGVALTSVIAGAATGVYAAFHFNHHANYGLAANMAAMPIFGFWVMPCAVLAALLTPFGLEGPAIAAMAAGVEAVLAIARAVAGWPGSVGRIADWPAATAVFVSLGGIWVCLWTKPWRWTGLAPAALGFALVPASAPPDILINRTGENVAVRLDSGDGEPARLAIRTARKDRYTSELWLRGDGDGRSRADAAAAWEEAFACDARGCVSRPGYRHRVAVVDDPMAVREDCTTVDVLVTTAPVGWRLRTSCSARIIDKWDLWRGGSHAVRFDGGGAGAPDVIDAETLRGRRPWTRASRLSTRE
ncbi:MAG: ComEC/Rec2 family competence protein, partial [Pseudomonadota bacterium]